MGSAAVGLLVDEHRAEIQDTWKRLVEEELGGEAAVGYAVGPLLRELSLALRGDVPALRRGHGPEGMARCTVLVRSGSQPARVAREFKLLHRALWDALRRAGRIVAVDDRRAADEWLDEALAGALDRVERVRMRIDLLERGPDVIAPARAAPIARPIPAPPAAALRSLVARPAAQGARSGATPPPLPWMR